MLSKTSSTPRLMRLSDMADWAVLALGVIMLTTAVVGTVVTPPMDVRAEAELAARQNNAAL